VDIRDNKLKYADQFGATHFLNASSDDVVSRVRALGAGEVARGLVVFD